MTEYENLSPTDQELVFKAQQGNNKAFDQLVLRYQRRIQDNVTSLIRDKAMANDLTQEVLIKAFRHINTFDNKCKFYTWVYTITLNVVRNHYKHNRRRPHEMHIDMFNADNVLDQFKMRELYNPEDDMQADDFELVVYNVIDELPESLRLAFMLREVVGLPYDEIALIMQCPIGTVRSRISRAREVIDKEMLPHTDQRTAP
jgi:RNA polymerase sigma-70 factor (ECF subfamily)